MTAADDYEVLDEEVDAGAVDAEYEAETEAQEARRQAFAGAKRKNRLIWAVCIFITIACLGLAAWIFMNDEENRAAASGGTKDPTAQCFLQYVQSGDIDNPAIAKGSQKLADALTPDVKAILKGGAPKNQPKNEPAPRDETTIALELTKNKVLEQHAHLKLLNELFDRATKMAVSKNAAELEQAVPDLKELESRIRSATNHLLAQEMAADKTPEHTMRVHLLGKASDNVEDNSVMGFWRKQLNTLGSTKTNRLLGDAEQSVKSDKSSDRYKRYAKYKAIASYYENGYALNDPVWNNDKETHDILLAELEKFEQAEKTSLDAGNTAYFEWVRASAKTQFETEQKTYKGYVDKYEAYVETYAKWLETMKQVAEAAGCATDGTVASRLDSHGQSVNKFRGDMKTKKSLMSPGS